MKTNDMLNLVDSIVTVQRIAQLVTNPESVTFITNVRTRFQRILVQERFRPSFSDYGELGFPMACGEASIGQADYRRETRKTERPMDNRITGHLEGR